MLDIGTIVMREEILSFLLKFKVFFFLKVFGCIVFSTFEGCMTTVFV